MLGTLGPGTILGYCTNVHAGATLDETRRNLAIYARAVRDLHAPAATLPIGLWLSAQSLHELGSSDQADHLRDWLASLGLQVFTINGFPFGDFHAPVVKHDVYHPDWSDPRRARFTIALARVLTRLMRGLPDDTEGSISTLPLAWRSRPDAADLAAMAANLRSVADQLRVLHHRTGRLIHLDIEPEPGCLLGRSADTAAFFDQQIPAAYRDYLRICHDICHSAVMFEDQPAELRRYAASGIRVGKVQISSAPAISFDSVSPSRVAASSAALHALAEPRYLHQTMIRRAGSTTFYEDLAPALAAEPLSGEWRTHFHVPIFADTIGPLQTTRAEIAPAIRVARALHDCRHFEVETYAWHALPPELVPSPTAESTASRPTDVLARGIARELTDLAPLAGELSAW